jgi:formate hydrogenlyase transcriptional activator
MADVSSNGGMLVPERGEAADVKNDAGLSTRVSNHRGAREPDKRPMLDYLKDRLGTSSKAVLPDLSASGLIRSNPGLWSVWHALKMVAPINSVVLILGETGTGKDLVARAVHDESPRKGGRYVKVNCGAIPAGLMENELFGHERGAFTGALTRTDGRFQQAHGGTLFLDEIGELPLELQPKLLRVLQDRECERVGGGCPLRIDVRVIAATNADLGEMVSQRRFRADLFYRLNVFPILVPPLRDRPDDVPLLVRHFIRTLSSQMNKEAGEIADEALQCLRRHTWPGNVRELQNVIERAIIRSSGLRLEISTEELKAGFPQIFAKNRMLAEAERSCILDVLKETNGVVSGPKGAALRLGLPRTTLMSRMQKLGIVQRKTVLNIEGNADP